MDLNWWQILLISMAGPVGALIGGGLSMLILELINKKGSKLH